MKSQETSKIDVEELMNDFRINDLEALQIYLKELWKDLSQRSDDKYKGINNITFSQFYNLPGIILDRLFNVFDSNKNGFLDLNEFINGMCTLFTESFDELIKLVFRFYDFDNNGKVEKEDIRTVLSYIPLNTSKYKKGSMKYENHDFNDRLESQDELQKILSTIFEKNSVLDLKAFTSVVENSCSEIFLYLIIFLLEKRPFSKSSLEAYSGLKKNIIKSPTITKKLIASPNMLSSKFSPSVTISKSPTISKKNLEIGGNKMVSEGINMLNQLTGKQGIKEPSNKLLNYEGNKSKQSSSVNKDKEEENIQNSHNPVRKTMNNLKNIEDGKPKKKIVDENILNSPQIKGASKYKNEGHINLKTDEYIEKDDDELGVKNEGFIYKITNNNKFKKLWFKQFDKDLYCKILSYFRL